MSNRGQNFTAVYDEHTGELSPVPALHTRAARERRRQPPLPDTRMCEFEQRSVLEIEGTIEMMLRIAEARNVEQPVLRKPSVGIRRGLHVHERNLRSSRLDGRTHPGQVRHRLTAEHSPEMPQEHEQHRLPARQGEQARAVLRPRGLEGGRQRRHGRLVSHTERRRWRVHIQPF